MDGTKKGKFSERNWISSGTGRKQGYEDYVKAKIDKMH